MEGEEPIAVSEPFCIVPVPGHTEGSMALLYDRRFLFSGDHLWWDRDTNQLGAPEHLVWSERHLLQSVAKLHDFPFEWVLPGHGDRVRLTAAEMSALGAAAGAPSCGAAGRLSRLTERQGCDEAGRSA